jgi:hypothetical protein
MSNRRLPPDPLSEASPAGLWTARVRCAVDWERQLVNERELHRSPLPRWSSPALYAVGRATWIRGRRSGS